MRELYRVWSSRLSSEEVDRVIAIASEQPVQDATIFGSREAVQEIRSCTVRWLSDDWVKDLLWPYVEEANEKAFHVDVHNHAEMQLTEYRAEQRGHYAWHHDVHWSGPAEVARKLSVTVQLSHADDYEGGDFEFDEVQTNADFRSQGTVLVFPSYLRHRICPVTSGTRRALVAWFFGPRWR